MGAKDSKRTCLSYEDAVKRMSDVEFKRVCEAFKRLTGGNQLLNRHTFTHHVLGDGVPPTIADWLFNACGGGPRGIALKDLICGLVLLTRGSQDEKIKFLWTLYCNDSGTYITRNEFQTALQIEGALPADLANKPNLYWDRTLISLFGLNQDRVSFEHFRIWIQSNRDATILSQWLLSPRPCVSLSSEVETPTFYQTLAGVTHLDEHDIGELEKCFWSLQSNSPSGNLDFNCVRDMVCPPVPINACEGLFLALDVNRDGHVDFKELCCGISAASRGPKAERMKFCFKIFDMDRDCYLNSNELQHMIETLLFITNENKIYTTTTSSSSTGCNNYNNNNNNNNSNNEEVPDVIATTTTTTHLLQQLLNNQENDDNNNTKTSLKLLANCLDAQGGLSQEEFLVWSVINDNCLVEPLLELLFQVCHVSLGLKPYCRHHEHDIVDGWLRREERRGYHVGQFWYLISTDWWQMWKNYTTGVRTNHDYCDCRCSNNNSSNTSNYSSSSNSSHSNANLQIEEGIVCDEGTLPSSHDYNHIIHSTNDYNNYYSTNNSMDSSSSMMSCGGGSGSVGGGGDLILTSNSNNNKNSGDNCSIASSSGVSSSSGGGCVIGNTTTVINTITTTTITNALTMTMKRTHGTGSIPGPIDNRSLVAEPQFKVATLTGEGGRLKRDIALVQHRDFVLIPDSLWKALALWYGGPLPLPRQVIRPPGSSDVELELYPLNLRILRHQQPQQQQFSGGSGGGSMATTTSTSSSSSWSTVVGGYGAAALSTAGLTSAPAALQSTRRYLAHTAAFSRLANVRQVIEFLCQRLILRVEDVRLWHIKETTNLLEDDNATLQDLGVFDCDQILLEVRNKDLTWPEELGALVSGGNNSNNNNNTTTNNGSTGGIGGLLLLNSERRPTICLPPGATGLHNLGNTCFMNAALQAVSNTRPLTMYFQRDGQLCELNSMNPLGTKGMVARRYAELCRELWAGSTRSVAPLKLRYCVTKHAPHLGGGGQHDSQELLAWLLDALHEDLNRVARKQYTELKDSGGRPDEVVADEAWTQHLARDHSIITDLFYGQLKSKVTCQMCGHESVRFDPFNLLSLPLPMESYTLCEVLVIRLNGETPVKYGLRLNSEAKYLELKEQLQFLCHIKSKRLLLAELSYSQIRQILMDDVRINPNTATELYAYELPDNSNNNGATEADEGDENNEILRDGLMEENAAIPDSPLARSPEVRGGSALCMPNILCFKNNNSNNNNNSNSTKKTNNNSEIPSSCNNGGSILLSSSSSSSTTPPSFKKSSIISLHSSSGRGGGNSSLSSGNSTYSDSSKKYPKYLIAVHRKSVRQETYFLSQQKSKPSLFGLPLLLGCSPSSTCQSLYEAVWSQVTRLLSPLPQSDQTNHATDCDDSLGYEFPFTLKAVLQGGQICAICHWTQFCRGCILSCSSKELLFERCRGDAAAIITNSDSAQNVMCIAIDWDPTALHLRYQSSREKLWIEDESVATCRKLHTEPIDLDYCLKAFTSEERLETKYHCSNCQDKQPATKKLQIWRLPPILIIHLKRFDYVNSKWVKTQKVVNFPFKDFDPTAYLASIPHETIIRHQQLLMKPHNIINNNKSYDLLLLDGSCESQVIISEEENDDDDDDNATDKIVNTTTTNNTNRLLLLNEHSKLMNDDVDVDHQSMSSTDNLIELKQFDDDTVVTIDDDKENNKKSSTNQQQQQQQQQRRRLESTSLMKTPVIDENLKDYHQHKLLPGQDPFDLKYQLYAVVSHSGLLNGGHYISYACNPNGNWYCYNDSSCREVLTDPTNKTINNNNKATTAAAPISTNSSNGCTPLSRRKNLRVNTTSNSTTFTNNNNINNSSESLNSNKNDCNDDDLLLLDTTTTGSTDGNNTVTINVPLPTASSINTTNILPTGSSSSTNLSTSNKNNNDESTSSTSSSSTAKCAYSDVRVPKIDTSSAYILFYERSGLDYKPYLPDLVTNIVNSNGSQIVPEVELDENESELRKQLCSIQ